LGGTCLNVGCIPTKALLESSHLYTRVAGGLHAHGVEVAGVRLNLSAMMERKQRVVKELTDGIARLMKRNKIEVVRGSGRLVGGKPLGVEVDGGENNGGKNSQRQSSPLRAHHVLLAMGSVPIELPFLAVDGERIVLSEHALAFGRVPESLVVVGGGAVGLELAAIWSRLGATVTVLEMADQIVPFADRQMAKMLARILKKQGLDIRVKARVRGAESDGQKVTVRFADGQKDDVRLPCETVLVAVGRRPNTAAQGLEAVGVKLDEKGRVQVDARFETAVDGVFAVGDLIAGPMLAHKAEEEGLAVADRLAGHAVDSAVAPADAKRWGPHDLIPNVVYTHPELAQVGLAEADAKQRGFEIKVGRFYFKANGRAHTMDDDDGLVKVIAEKESGRLLGIHILGTGASELIGEATVALARGASAAALGDLIHAHPTLSEAVKEAALAADRRAIHG
jgi:dihydrolipoamide dehydrogenase